MTEKTEEEKERQEKRDRVFFICFLIAVVAFVAGYAYGHLTGVFDGYQFALKQFEIIKYVPEMIP